MIQKFLDALDESKEYDFIANYYSQMSKDELKNVLLEYIYASHQVGDTARDKIVDCVRDELTTNSINW